MVKDKGRLDIPEENLLKKDEIIGAFDYIKVSPEDRVKFSDTGWISGMKGTLNKKNIKELSLEEVLKFYNVNPEILKSLDN